MSAKVAEHTARHVSSRRRALARALREPGTGDSRAYALLRKPLAHRMSFVRTPAGLTCDPAAVDAHVRASWDGVYAGNAGDRCALTAHFLRKYRDFLHIAPEVQLPHHWSGSTCLMQCWGQELCRPRLFAPR